MKVWYLGHPETKKVVGLVTAKDLGDLFWLIDAKDNPHDFLYLPVKHEAVFILPDLFTDGITHWGEGIEHEIDKIMAMKEFNRKFLEPSSSEEEECTDADLNWKTFVELCGGPIKYAKLYDEWLPKAKSN